MSDEHYKIKRQLDGIQAVAKSVHTALVHKSKWQTKDGKWWVNDGSGKKPYKEGNDEPSGGGDKPNATESLKKKVDLGDAGALAKSPAFKQHMEEQLGKKITDPQELANLAEGFAKQHQSGGADSGPTTDPKSIAKEIKKMTPEKTKETYMAHLNSDPDFKESELKRVAGILEEDSIDETRLMSILDNVTPGDMKKGAVEAFSTYAKGLASKKSGSGSVDFDSSIGGIVESAEVFDLAIDGDDLSPVVNFTKQYQKDNDISDKDLARIISGKAGADTLADFMSDLSYHLDTNG